MHRAGVKKQLDIPCAAGQPSDLLVPMADTTPFSRLPSAYPNSKQHPPIHGCSQYLMASTGGYLD